MSPPEEVTCATLQAAAWLSWEHAVSSSRTNSLQFWNGSQWRQTDFPNSDRLRRSLPLASEPPTQEAAAPAAPTNQPAGSASPSNAAASRQSSSTQQEAAQPAPMSGFTSQAILECHYSHNSAFLQEPLLQVLVSATCLASVQITTGSWKCAIDSRFSQSHMQEMVLALQGIDKIRQIPCIAVQGRLDYVCPVVTAYDLHCEWPEMELRVIPNAGHSMYDDAIQHELLDATDRLRKLAPKKTRSVSRSTLPARYASI